MNKKFLLAAIPALMVLSSCTFMESATAVKNNGFLEDCLAHDEIFGNASEALAPKRAFGPSASPFDFEATALDPALNPDVSYTHPAIGVQTFFDGDHTVSFRFVAAVHFNNADAREATNAVWTRTVSKADCSSYPLDNDVTPAPAVTKAYLALSNDGGSYSINDYNNDHRDGEDKPAEYTHFVVYTLRNIDLNNYAGNSYYVSAYLSLSGAVGNVQSKAIAIRFDREKKYTYVHNVGTGYIEGTFSGTPAIIDKTAVDNDSNAASFLNRPLSKDDTFVIKAFDGTKLKIRNNLDFAGDSSYYFSNDEGKIKANYSGVYNLYLNSEQDIYTTAVSLNRKLYVSLADGSVNWWEGSGVFTALYAYVDGGSGQWIELDSLGNHLYVTKTAVNTATYDRAIVGRIDVSEKDNASTGWWTSGKVYNQTKGGDDSSSSISLLHDHAYVKRNSEQEPLYIDWWN